MELSQATKYMLDNWLRGVRKGYGVQLDASMDTCEYSREEQIQVIGELWELSGGVEDLALLLSWGIGAMSKKEADEYVAKRYPSTAQTGAQKENPASDSSV